MKKDTILNVCTMTSAASIAVGFALLIAAIGGSRTSQWGEVTMGCTPQAILIVGGLLALAICSLSSRD